MRTETVYFETRYFELWTNRAGPQNSDDDLSIPIVSTTGWMIVISI